MSAEATVRQILDRVEATLSRLGATPTALTAVPARQPNRWVYRADLAGGAVWYVKVFGDPDRYDREARALATIAPGIGPTVIAAHDADGILLTEAINGTVAAGDRSVDADKMLADCLVAFRALLATGIESPTDPIPIPLDVGYGRHFRLLAATSGCEEAALRAWVATAQPLLPCHGDLTPNNVIVTSTGVRLIDFEFFGVSQPLYDAASLCLSPSLSLPIQRRTATLARYAQAVADADGQLLPVPSLCGAAAMWAVRFGERLYTSGVDAGLVWQTPLRIAGETIAALIDSQRSSWHPVHRRTRRTP
jgi:aminoglycoside phosphotransferase